MKLPEISGSKSLPARQSPWVNTAEGGLPARREGTGRLAVLGPLPLRKQLLDGPVALYHWCPRKWTMRIYAGFRAGHTSRENASGKGGVGEEVTPIPGWTHSILHCPPQQRAAAGGGVTPRRLDAAHLSAARAGSKSPLLLGGASLQCCGCDPSPLTPRCRSVTEHNPGMLRIETFPLPTGGL